MSFTKVIRPRARPAAKPRPVTSPTRSGPRATLHLKSMTEEPAADAADTPILKRS